MENWILFLIESEMDGDTGEAASLSTPTGGRKASGLLLPLRGAWAPRTSSHTLLGSAFCWQGSQSAHLTPLSSAHTKHTNARGSPELSVLLSPPHCSRAETEDPGQGTTEGRSALSQSSAPCSDLSAALSGRNPLRRDYPLHLGPEPRCCPSTRQGPSTSTWRVFRGGREAAAPRFHAINGTFTKCFR